MSGQPAARLGDGVAYGVIVQGSATVLIGSAGGVACSVCPGGMAVGSPVNPALGAKVLGGGADLDFALPGPLAVIWQRQYSSYVNAEHGPRLGPLGFGWTLPSDVSWRWSGRPAADGGCAGQLFDASGRVIGFAPLAPGASLYSPSEDLWLLRGGPGLEDRLNAARALAGRGSGTQPTPAELDALAEAARWQGLTHLSGDLLADPAQLFATGPGNIVWHFAPIAGANADRLPLRGLIDRYGRRQHGHYDDNGRLTELRDGVGRRYRLLYDTCHTGRPAAAGWPADPGVRIIGVDLIADPLTPDTGLHPLVRYRYDPEGNLAEVIDRHGHPVRQFAYRHHRLTYHRERRGPEHRYRYESDRPGARVVEQHNQDGLAYRFDYRDDENAVIVTDTLNRIDHYRFQGEGGLKRLSEHRRADGSVLRYDYDSAGRLTAEIDPLGQETRYRLDAQGRLLGLHSPGGTSEARYDPAGRLSAAITPAGRITHYRYDAWGRLSELIAADGHTTRYAYPDPGQDPLVCEHPTRITDARGGIKRLLWSPAGQLLAYTDCSERSTHYRYDRWGELLETTDPLGQTRRYRRDGEGRVEDLIQADGSRVRYRYHPNGPVAEETDPLGRIVRYHYDLWNRLTRREQAGHGLTLEYDVAGRLTALVNENGARTSFAYDPLDRLIREIGIDGRAQAYRYDPAGRLIEASDGNAGRIRVTGYAYDSAGRLVQRRIAATETAAAECHRFRYDADGLLLAADTGPLDGERLLSQVLFERDPLGRPVAETQRLHGATGELEFEYRIGHRHAPLGHRAATELADLGELDWQTYGSGHVHGLTLERQSLIDFDRDAGHREIARRLANGLSESRRIDPLGRVLAQGFAGALAERRYEYDPAGQLLALAAGERTWRYRYDAVGRLIGAQDAGREFRYRFDPAGNRLPEPAPAGMAATSAPWAERVRQNLDDPAFNLIGQDPNAGAVGIAQVGQWPLNRVDHHAGHVYRYDLWGNRVEAIGPDGAPSHFAYDGLHRLVAVRTADSVAHYRYDAFGRRLAKTVTGPGAGTTTRYGWDGDRLVRIEDGQRLQQVVYEPDSFVPLLWLERDMGKTSATAALVAAATADPDERAALRAMFEAQPAALREGMDASFAQVAQHGLPERARTMMPEGFDWSGANAVLAQTRRHLEQNAAERPITLRYFHCDHLGTPFAVSDASGKVVWSATFDPWGRLLDEFNPEGIDQPIRFQGQFFDPESGLHYNRHRFYDPNIGSYINQDPIGLAGGANLYAYVRNPNGWIDPQGLIGAVIRGGAAASSIAIGGAARGRGKGTGHQSGSTGFPDLDAGMPRGTSTPSATDEYGVRIDPKSGPLTEAHKQTNRDSAKPGYGGNCTPQEYDDLENNKKRICNEASSLGGCTGGMPKVEQNIRRSAWSRCAHAREEVMNRCFSGGDAGHRKAANQGWETANGCSD